MKKITLLLTLLAFTFSFAQTTAFPVYDGTFGGVTYAQSFTFPTGAEAWGGFANNNTSIYPLSYPNGGQVSFKASVPAAAEVYFRFEANPYPNVDPAIVTANVALDPATTDYTVNIPANASNTYNSALMYVVTRDVEVKLSEIKLIQYDTDGLTALSTAFPTYDGTFGGVTYAQSFTFPTGAETWGGFANNNTSIYPLSYPNGGQVSFKASVPAAAEVYFRFEANPYPNVDPAIVTANVALDPATTDYTVDIPANASNTYNSALMYVVTRDVEVKLSEIKLIRNAVASIEDFSVNSIKMFPNPAKDVVQFSKKSNEPLDIQIFDMLGKSLIAHKNVQSEVNISSLRTGVYFVQMTLGTKATTKKLVVH